MTRVITALLICLLIATPASAGLFFSKDKPQAQPEADVQVTFDGTGITDPAQAEKKAPEIPEGKFAYTLGPDDVIEISILQPDKFSNVVTVTPDGYVSCPYIGSVQVKGLTPDEAQNLIQSRLADGYMKYPVVLVTLKQSNSRKFFVYGEVAKPGTYPIQENTTVLRAISMAGGFTKFGSSARVKILRPRDDKPGYDPIKIDIKRLMNGSAEEDILLKPWDIVVVSEGLF